jgi:hypothetical protein
MARDDQTASIIEVAPVQNLLKNLSGVRRFGSDAEVVEHQGLNANETVDLTLLLIRRFHAELADQLEGRDYGDGATSRKTPAKNRHRQMRFADPAGTPQIGCRSRD